MKAKLLGVVAAVALFCGFSVGAAKANSVDVSYTVSGSAGDWLVDFSVTNNLGSGWGIYVFGTALPSTDIVNSPNPNWTPPFAYSVLTGASGTSYNNLWCVYACLYNGDPNFAVDQSAAGIQSGETLSGFVALDTALIFPASLPWIVDATLVVNGTIVSGSQFEGIANTPLPAALPLFATGLGALGLFGWRRKRQNAAA